MSLARAAKPGVRSGTRMVVVRTAALVGCATLGLVGGVEANPGHAHLAAGLWAVVISAVTAEGLLRWARTPDRPRSAFDVPRRRPGPRSEGCPPRALAAMEGVVSGAIVAPGDADRRLLPLLRGFDRGTGPARVVTGGRRPERDGDEASSRAAALLLPEAGGASPWALHQPPGRLDLDAVEELVALVERERRER